MSLIVKTKDVGEKSTMSDGKMAGQSGTRPHGIYCSHLDHGWRFAVRQTYFPVDNMFS
jgi:hypothetical protein